MSRLRVTSRWIEEDRPLLDLPPVDDATCWVRRGEGLIGWGTAARISPGPGPDRFARAEAELRALAEAAEVDDPVAVPGSGLVGLGSFAFTDEAHGSVLRVPQVLIGRRDGRTWRTDVTADDLAPAPEPSETPPREVPRDRPRYAGSSLPDLAWLEAVAAAVERIADGELAKVVLARDHAVWSEHRFDALDLARRLHRRFPRCHTFVADGLVGATPELLLARDGDRVTSRVLAGTTGRSDDEGEDAALGAALLASDKDQHEHRLAADSVREVLAPRCAQLEEDPHPRLLRLDNVQHLATVFRGRLAEAGASSSLALVAALHPTAAVGGTPRGDAVALIAALEGMERGRYAAPVGWTDAAGDGEWGIALRCAELSGARARLFAGVGVVGASLPEDELEETRLKLRAMQAVLAED